MTMKVKLQYSPSQMWDAINFLAARHPSDIGPWYIHDSIKESMNEMVEKFPHLLQISTIGYTLIADISEESLDNDENLIAITILIDPSVGRDFEETYEIFDIKRENS